MEAEEDITSLTYSPDDEEPRLKIVLVGDSDVGKFIIIIIIITHYSRSF